MLVSPLKRFVHHELDADVGKHGDQRGDDSSVEASRAAHL